MFLNLNNKIEFGQSRSALSTGTISFRLELSMATLYAFTFRSSAL